MTCGACCESQPIEEIVIIDSLADMETEEALSSQLSVSMLIKKTSANSDGACSPKRSRSLGTRGNAAAIQKNVSGDDQSSHKKERSNIGVPAPDSEAGAIAGKKANAPPSPKSPKKDSRQPLPPICFGVEKANAPPSPKSPNRESRQPSLPIGALVYAQVDGEEHLGYVKFVGETKFAVGTWVGIEFETARGKHDGTVFGRKYFTCRPGRGVFVRPSMVRLWDPQLPSPDVAQENSSGSLSAVKPAVEGSHSPGVGRVEQNTSQRMAAFEPGGESIKALTRSAPVRLPPTDAPTAFSEIDAIIAELGGGVPEMVLISERLKLAATVLRDLVGDRPTMPAAEVEKQAKLNTAEQIEEVEEVRLRSKEDKQQMAVEEATLRDVKQTRRNLSEYFKDEPFPLCPSALQRPTVAAEENRLLLIAAGVAKAAANAVPADAAAGLAAMSASIAMFAQGQLNGVQNETKQRKAVEQELKQAQDVTTRLSGELEQSQKSNIVLHDEKARLVKELEASLMGNVSLHDQQTRMIGEFEAMRKSHATLKGEKTRLITEFTALQHEKARLDCEFEASRRGTTALQRKLTHLTGELEASQKTIIDLQGEKMRSVIELEASLTWNTALLDEKMCLNGELEALRTSNTELEDAQACLIIELDMFRKRTQPKEVLQAMPGCWSGNPCWHLLQLSE